jgi:type I restriction enzyme M protein
MATTDSRADSERTAILNRAAGELRDSLGYDSFDMVSVEDEPCAVAVEGGRPLVLIHVPEGATAVDAAEEELALQLGAVVENGPADYVWATATGAVGEGFIYCWLPEQECQVSSMPPRKSHPGLQAGEAKGTYLKADPTRFKQLQREFDSLHEQVYASREPVDGSNDLTAQLCKLIFLKMHYERNPDFRPIAGSPLFEEVFTPDYILAHGSDAVALIKKAFDVARAHPDYCIQDEHGHDFRIFDPDDFIKFNQPATYARIAEMLNRHRLTSPEETGIEDDILGRAFDVMLRAKFESKGGMGIYLTPQQVRDAMVQMAFHDILKEDPGAITRRDPATHETQFRTCDPCCGSAGFLVTAMREIQKHVGRLLGLSQKQRAELLRDILTQGVIGADSSPNMVLMARINMALHGDPKARVFRVENSLTSDVFRPESHDLILTNPPFKKGGIKESDQPDLLAAFRSDIAGNSPQMTGDALALGSKPDGKGVWKPVRSVDPAVLFIDRCLQLLKPGGRLLAVVPDGILCNSGDRYVREYLMGVKDEATGKFVGGKAVVRAVVSLPPVTFRLSGAGAKTSFVYLQKKRPGDEQGPVFMAVAEGVGFDVKQNKEVRTDDNDLVKIVEAYKAGPSSTQDQS